MYKIIETEERETSFGEWVYSFHILDESTGDIAIKQKSFLQQLTTNELKGIQAGALDEYERECEQLALSQRKDEVVLVKDVEKLLRKHGRLKQDEKLSDLK